MGNIFSVPVLENNGEAVEVKVKKRWGDSVSDKFLKGVFREITELLCATVSKLVVTDQVYSFETLTFEGKLDSVIAVIYSLIATYSIEGLESNNESLAYKNRLVIQALVMLYYKFFTEPESEELDMKARCEDKCNCDDAEADLQLRALCVRWNMNFISEYMIYRLGRVLDRHYQENKSKGKNERQKLDMEYHRFYQFVDSFMGYMTFRTHAVSKKVKTMSKGATREEEQSSVKHMLESTVALTKAETETLYLFVVNFIKTLPQELQRQILAGNEDDIVTSIRMIRNMNNIVEEKVKKSTNERPSTTNNSGMRRDCYKISHENGHAAAEAIINKVGNAPLTRLMEAAKNGDLELVKTIVIEEALSRKADLKYYVNEATTDTKMTSLSFAVENGDIEIVKALLKAGADIVGGGGQETSIMSAARKGELEILNFLLSHVNLDEDNLDGFDPFNGETALSYALLAGRLDIMKVLIRHGANYNKLFIDNCTLLMKAIIFDRDEIALYIMDMNKDTENYLESVSLSEGLSALCISLRKGNLKLTMELLERGANSLACTKDCSTMLHVAALRNNFELFEKLYEYIMNKLKTETVAAFVGAVQNCQNKYYMEQFNFTPSDTADIVMKKLVEVKNKTNGFCPLLQAARSGNIQIARFLIGKGASLECTDNNGWTPLMHAAYEGYPSICQDLICHSANARHISPGYRYTALMLACLKRNEKVVKFLLEKSMSDPFHKTSNGETAMYYAIKHWSVKNVELLLNHGFRVNSDTGLGQTPLFVAIDQMNIEAVQYLLKKGASLDSLHPVLKISPLIYACRLGYDHIVQELIKYPQDLNFTTQKGESALSECIMKKNIIIGRMLIQKNISVERAKGHEAFLHLAIKQGDSRFTSLLLNNKADVNYKPKRGPDAMELACTSGDIDIVQLLLMHDADIGNSRARENSYVMQSFKEGHVNVVRFILPMSKVYPSEEQMQHFIVDRQKQAGKITPCLNKDCKKNHCKCNGGKDSCTGTHCSEKQNFLDLIKRCKLARENIRIHDLVKQRAVSSMADDLIREEEKKKQALQSRKKKANNNKKKVAAAAAAADDDTYNSDELKQNESEGVEDALDNQEEESSIKMTSVLAPCLTDSKSRPVGSKGLTGRVTVRMTRKDYSSDIPSSKKIPSLYQRTTSASTTTSTAVGISKTESLRNAVHDEIRQPQQLQQTCGFSNFPRRSTWAQVAGTSVAERGNCSYISVNTKQESQCGKVWEEMLLLPTRIATRLYSRQDARIRRIQAVTNTRILIRYNNESSDQECDANHYTECLIAGKQDDIELAKQIIYSVAEDGCDNYGTVIDRFISTLAINKDDVADNATVLETFSPHPTLMLENW